MNRRELFREYVLWATDRGHTRIEKKQLNRFLEEHGERPILDPTELDSLWPTLPEMEAERARCDPYMTVQ